MNDLIISPKHHTIAVPWREDFANIFHGVPEITFKGNRMLIVEHGIDQTKFLRNMGYEVPAPVLSHYDFEGGTPFDVQRKTVAMLTMAKRAYVLNGMGTGKTKAALWAWRYLHRIGEAQKLLVVAPLSTLNFTWAKEIFMTLPGIKMQVLHGTKAKRLERLRDQEADIYIVNHDGLGVIAQALADRSDIDTCILDELAVYRNGSSNRVRVTRKVTGVFKHLWGMTGSPVPNAPTDAWAQCSIITPGMVPRYFNRFRDEVMVQVSPFRYVAKDGALDRVFSAMQPSVRFTLDDVVELPDLIERTIDVELGTKQAKVYQEMERHAFAAIAAKEITALNAGAVLNKLLQISTGYVYTREREVVTLDNAKRLDALIDAVNSTDRKIIVFVPFIHAMQAVMKHLQAEGYDAVSISGETPHTVRNQIFDKFQNTDRIRILVAHPQCMAHGITLTAADTIIWFAPIPDLEIFEQANARIRRVGQKHKQQVLMLQATRSERKTYAKLRSKQKVQNTLLDMFAEASE